MDPRLQRGFRIGVFDVEPLSGRITGPGGTQHLQPKVMDVLVFLAARSGELVERDTLLEQVWKRITSEEVLTRCISELRRALGDDRGSPTYIQTVPKRGYRLVGDVVPREQPARAGAAPATATSTATVAAPPDNPPTPASAMASVAVLPFDTHSADPAHQFMGDAFAAELHSTLARVDRLRVASRRSSFIFKDTTVDIREIGKRLNVGFVISGSLRRSGPNLHVVAELNDASDGTQVWAQTYDRKNEDLLAVDKEIAEAIVGSFTTEQLRAETKSARHKETNSLDAWGLVQKSRSFVLDYTSEALAAAIEPLERAIELDKNYAAAHATLGSLLVERLVNGLSADPAKDEAAAVEAAAKALALAPQDPFILKMVSLVSTYAGDHRKAINCLRKAVAATPYDFGAWGYMGWPMTASGDADDLRDLRGILDRLLATEPNHPGAAFWHYHKSVAATCAGDYDTALEAVEAALDLRPTFALAWMHCANVLGHKKAKEKAAHALEQCAKINPAMTPKHFESLVKKMSKDKGFLEHRLGGLRNIGALRK